MTKNVGISLKHTLGNLLTTIYKEYFPHVDLPIFINWISLPFILMK